MVVLVGIRTRLDTNRETLFRRCFRRLYTGRQFRVSESNFLRFVLLWHKFLMTIIAMTFRYNCLSIREEDNERFVR